MAIVKKDIRTLSLDELITFIEEHGEKKFRAKQVMEWLWKKSATSFEQMNNIGKGLQQLLTEHFEFSSARLADKQVSSDGTVKCAFKVDEDKVVEGVLIPTKSRMTACISSQVGCSLACKFCATGRLKMLRNLTAGEIYDQVAFLKNDAEALYKIPLSNIVYMGMGEPLLNYANVLESIERITSHEGLGMAPKRITVSTAGIAKMIKKLGDDQVKFNLALSLHAANDIKRDKIMPINEHNSLEALKEALQYFYSKTKSRVTLEYIVFKGFNDEISDARELAEFCKSVPCKVNLIEYNPIEGGEFTNAAEDKINAFWQFLVDRNIIVNFRRSRGKDIDAACGQLANKH